MGLNITILITLLLALMGSGLYTGFSMAGVGIVGLEFLRNLGTAVGAILYNAANSFPLASVPMFLLMGQVVLRAGLGSRLYEGTSKWTSIIPGGLLHTNIVSCSIFAAVSGSSPATAATIGSVAYPEQIKRGYNIRTIAGSLAAGGTLGILIPPSITMIVYGAFVSESIGKLFIGGVLPGIILSLMFMCYIGLSALRDPSQVEGRQRLTKRYFRDAIVAWKDVLPTFSIIITIMGSIYAGIMTPTEAAAVSAFIAMILGIALGKLNFTKSFALLKDSAVETVRITSMVILLFAGAFILGGALALLRIPAYLAMIITSLELSPLWIWFGVIVLYLVLGCFMTALPMMLVTLPVTFPLIVELGGYNPIWFGVMLVILSEIAMITPPIGINLFVIQGIAKGIDQDVSLWTVARGSLPFIVCMLLLLALCTFVPDLVLFLPNQMSGS